MSLTHCKATKADGSRCLVDFGLDALGFCQVHTPNGGREHQRAFSAKGGEATRRAWAAEGFTPEELPAIETVEDAKTALDAIRRAALTGKITHAVANAASKAVSEWVRAEGAAQTQRVVTELQRELDAKTQEIADLRKQLAAKGRTMRVAS